MDFTNFGSEQFEELVVQLCRELFGQGVQGFSPGKDGGRDARFNGKAECYVSTSSPWSGLTIIQAKHTRAINATIADEDFFKPSRNDSDIVRESQKLKKLVHEDGVRNYCLFTNRKVLANVNERIRKYISKVTELPDHNIGIIGLEDLNSYFRGKYNFVLENYKQNHNALLEPIAFSADEISSIIIELKEIFGQPNKNNISQYRDIIRTTLESKNKINNVTKKFSERNIEAYLFYNKQISEFLESPENQEYQLSYEETIEEIQNLIGVNKQEYQSFEEILLRIISIAIDRDCICRSNKSLTKRVIYYMYENCDIGKKE